MRSSTHNASGLTRFYNRKENSVMFLFGGMLIALSLAMVPSLVVAILEGESLDIMVVPIVMGLVFGVPIFMRHRLASVVRPPDALAMMAVLWLTCFLFGMLPYLMFGMSFVDALFESASAFTTTGVDVIPDLIELPQCILFWKVTSSWVGGIMIILIFMLLMPMVGGGTRTALGNETSGSSGAYNMTMRLRDAAIQFTQVYFMLTMVMTLILICMGYTLYESITVSMCTISSGGFLVVPIEFTTGLKIIILIFMFLGAINFYLHYRAMFQKELTVYRGSGEFKAIVAWCLFMSFVLFFMLNPDLSGNLPEKYLNSLFMTVSASSTAGFSFEDFGSWHYSAMAVLYLLAFVGASAGSTAGGIKMSRLIIASKAIAHSFVQILRPNSISHITFDGSEVPKDVVRNALIVIMLFIITIVGFALLFMVFGYQGEESISCSVALISNFGSAVGEFGPLSGYGSAPAVLKLIMVLMMWMGRLEVLVALAIMSPRIWKEQFRNVMHGRWKSSQE